MSLLACAGLQPAQQLVLQQMNCRLTHPKAGVVVSISRLGSPVASLSLRPQFFFGDDDDGAAAAAQSADTWMPTSLITTTPLRDPYKIASRVLPIVLLHVAWSCLVVALRLLPTKHMPRPWNISWTVHSLTGGVLGLLLAFRTNQAWTRYWSAAQSWADVHRACHNLARLTAGIAPTDPRAYATFMRHLIALPISLKQRVRGGIPDPSEYFWPVLAPGESDAVVRSSVPHLVLLSSLSLLLQPVRSKDDGGGKDLALWGQCESMLSELQRAVASLDLVARLPPPASYSTHTARFVLLWLATLPFVLVDMFAPPIIPLVVLAVAWALYSTEELAKLLDAPFGRAGFVGSGAGAGPAGEASRRGVPEAVPVEAYCDRIVSELQQQVAITQMLQRRVEGGQWAVTPEDLEPTDWRQAAEEAGGAAGSTTDAEAVDAFDDEDDEFFEVISAE